MILEAQHVLAHLFQLGFHHCRLTVVETLRVTLVVKPDASANGQSLLLRLVQDRLEAVGAPSADRVAARLLEFREGTLAARAFDEKRLVVHIELKAVRSLADFHFRRAAGPLRFGSATEAATASQEEGGNGKPRKGPACLGKVFIVFHV